METSITSETISQKTICGEPEYPNKDCKLDQAQNKEYMTEIEQTMKNLIQVREVYLITFHLRGWLIQNTQ